MNHADVLYYNGLIYTADKKEPFTEAMAVAKGKIIALGTAAALQACCTSATQKADLGGRFLMPSFIDSHLHPPGLALLDLYEVNLTAGKTMADYLACVSAFLKAHPGLPAVYGRGWSWSALAGEEASRGPRKEHLDALSATTPIILRAYDGHTLWLNSAAFAKMGVAATTPSPDGGVIERNPATGELWGTLKERAMQFVALPDYTIEQYTDAMRLFQAKMHRFGITAILAFGSQTLDKLLAACQRLEQAGELLLHVRAAATVSPHAPLQEQLSAIEAQQAAYHSRQIKLTTAKFFADGVIEGGTGHLLEPYEAPGPNQPASNGPFLWDEGSLLQAFLAANRCGLQIHVHATGDAAVHKTLNALEKAAAVLPGDYRNAITHLQLVSKDDIARFAALGVIASVQPYWHCKGPGWWREVDCRLLGDRAEQEFPLASFFNSGAIVASSSDYHATVVPNPLLAIDTGVTRNLPAGGPYGLPDITSPDDPACLLNANERASLEDMLLSFTKNNAYMLFAEHVTGSLVPGKSADFIVLSENPFDVKPVELDKIRVLATYFQGRCVYNDATGLD